ncbi:MAG: CoA pyrophosphatase [Alphaproteobacteria bacterium]
MDQTTSPPAGSFSAADFRQRAAGRLLSAPGSLAADKVSASDFDLNPYMASQQSDPLKPAAVLVAIRDLGNHASIILTRRAASLSSHAGQIAFPGGRIDATDTGPHHTALREAHEEIGLDPGQVKVLGYLDPYRTGTGYHICPVVGIVTGGFTPVAEPGEVDQIFEVPLGFAMDPANLYIHATPWRGTTAKTYALAFEGYEIWGATAAMLKNLFDRVYRQ